jgi:iron complex transport system permease protein
MVDSPTGSVVERYSRFVNRKTLFLLLGVLFLFLLILFAACAGAADLTVLDVLTAIGSRFIPGIVAPPFNDAVIWTLRLPRVVMAIVCGIGLAVSGAQMQGITRNPLVSPFTLGISSAAALGASVVILSGVVLAGFGTVLVIGAAFGCSMLCAMLVFGLAKLKGASPETIILAGIALSYFFSAITSVLQFFASEQDLMAMVHWTFGTFTGVTWNEIGIVSLVVALCVPLCMKYSWDLNALSAGGDEAAKGVGVNVSRVRSVSLLLSAFMTATIISFTGIIGFVCLVSPHIARYLVGGDHRFLIPGSCIVGAILTIAADTVGRTILSPIILPISIVVSFIGVPLFLYLLLKRKQDYWRK